MNFAEAANWVCQHPGHTAIITALVVAGVAGTRAHFKAEREKYRASKERVDGYLNRPRSPSPKLPPHTWER